MSRRRDAALAGGVLSVVVAGGVAVDAGASPGAFALGALGAVVLEVVASARAARVRAAWRRRSVRALAVAVAALAVAAAAVVAPDAGLNALAGGLIAYLVLLALVARGRLPPSSAWFERP